jgi:hypothetical protein
MINTNTCRGCGRQIVFIRMKTGKLMPCDPVGVRFMPMPGAKETYITPDGSAIRGAQAPDGAMGYISHFATCPAADKFRGGRKKGE